MTAPPGFVLITVRWNDAHGSTALSYSLDELSHRPMVMDTVGWLLREDQEGISMANEYCPEDKTWRGVNFIPRGMIVEVKPVLRKRARAKACP